MGNSVCSAPEWKNKHPIVMALWTNCLTCIYHLKSPSECKAKENKLQLTTLNIFVPNTKVVDALYFTVCAIFNELTVYLPTEVGY